MSLKTHKKIGFFAAISMVLGSVVGIGIFLKNHSILNTNSWSGTGTLVSWLLGGLLALAAAISFSEISSQKSGKTIGLADWAEKAGGKKFGFFVRTNYSLFYFGILVLVIGMFASETIFSIFTSTLGIKMPHFGYIALLGLGLVVIVTLIAYFSIKASGYIQTITTALKFIPLVLVAVIGIALATTNQHSTSLSSTDELFGVNAFINGRAFDPVKMLAALPAVLFAYDAFLVVAQVKNKMKNPDKLPLAVSVGMIIVIVLYTFIAISAILHGSGMVSGGVNGSKPELGQGIFDQVFSPPVASGFGTFTIVFIAISTYGVLNGLTTGALYTFIGNVETNSIFGSKQLEKKLGINGGGLALFLGTILFYFVIIAIPAIATNNDAFVDAASNMPVLVNFLIYSLVILGYTLKRKTLTHKKINNATFNIFAWIAIIGILFLFGYQFFYGLTIKNILDPNTDNVAGLFALGKKFIFTPIYLFIVSIIMFILALAIPTLNFVLIKFVEKRNPIEDSKETVKTLK